MVAIIYILTNFFGFKTQNFFKKFSLIHITTLIIIAIVIFLVLFFIKKKGEKEKKALRITLAIIASISQISYMLWLIVNGRFDIKESLPLHLCSLALILVIFVTISKNKLLFNLLYFWGLGGGLNALIFPDIFHNFPHFRFFQFFIAHSIIILTILYFIIIERYDILFKELLISIVVTIGYIFFIFIINLILNSNYLYLMKKPYFNPFLDVFGDFHQIGLVIMVIGLFIILYLPFEIKRRSKF